MVFCLYVCDVAIFPNHFALEILNIFERAFAYMLRVLNCNFSWSLRSNTNSPFYSYGESTKSHFASIITIPYLLSHEQQVRKNHARVTATSIISCLNGLTSAKPSLGWIVLMHWNDLWKKSTFFDSIWGFVEINDYFRLHRVIISAPEKQKNYFKAKYRQ